MVITNKEKRLGVRHYVPILRWKEAERLALGQLYTNDAEYLTPLVELVSNSFIETGSKSLRDNSFVTSKIAGQLYQSWGEQIFFIDLWNLNKEILEHGHTHPLILLGQYANVLRMSLIPVTGINRDAEYKVAVRTVLNMFQQGACLRLTLEDIKSPELSGVISEELSFLSLTPGEVDLLIDFQIIDHSAPTFASLFTIIPNLAEWRNLIIAAGAFPKDLSKLKPNEKHILERTDWINWKHQFDTKARTKRVPVYSDYTIQHAFYSHRTGRLRYSASIRYTTDESWIIMRGEDVFKPNGPGFKQYPDWAMLLCDLPEFCGDKYCMGDKYIKEMSQQTVKTGSASEWLQAGINHHMTFVVRQLATLHGI
jgi:hypothetical protein